MREEAVADLDPVPLSRITLDRHIRDVLFLDRTAALDLVQIPLVITNWIKDIDLDVGRAVHKPSFVDGDTLLDEFLSGGNGVLGVILARRSLLSTREYFLGQLTDPVTLGKTNLGGLAVFREQPLSVIATPQELVAAKTREVARF